MTRNEKKRLDLCQYRHRGLCVQSVDDTARSEERNECAPRRAGPFETISVKGTRA